MAAKKVLVTGASGYIGGSVAMRLLEKGYAVTGLVRKVADGEALTKLGLNAVTGNITDFTPLQQLAKEADIIINAADADNPYPVSTILPVIVNTGKTFIHTSGSSIVGDKAAGEYRDITPHTDIPEPLLEKRARVAIDREVLGYAQQGVRTVVICPTMIYGEGLGLKKNSVQVPILIKAAEKYGKGVHVGKGENRWSNVHIADLADLYWLAVEKAAAGSFFFAENGIASLRSIAEAVSRQLGYDGATQGLSLDESIALWGAEAAHFGLGSNSIVSAEKARKELGWKPVRDELLRTIAV